jgi:hypothetical protein
MTIQDRLSTKHRCNFRDCDRFAIRGHLMCPRHFSAGGYRPESRALSDKSRELSEEGKQHE